MFDTIKYKEYDYKNYDYEEKKILKAKAVAPELKFGAVMEYERKMLRAEYLHYIAETQLMREYKIPEKDLVWAMTPYVAKSRLDRVLKIFNFLVDKQGLIVDKGTDVRYMQHFEFVDFARKALKDKELFDEHFNVELLKKQYAEQQEERRKQFEAEKE